MSSLPILYIAPLTVFLAELPQLIGAGTSYSISGEAKPPTIEELRRLVARAQWRPYWTDREVLIICRIEELHPAAANSLLKFLEEPPEWTRLILQATTEAVLPTIGSRVRIKRLAGTSSAQSLSGLLELSYTERLALVEGLLADQPTTLLQGLLAELRAFPADTRHDLGALLLRLLPLLERGANKKLVLEYLMLSLPRTESPANKSRVTSDSGL